MTGKLDAATIVHTTKTLIFKEFPLYLNQCIVCGYNWQDSFSNHFMKHLPRLLKMSINTHLRSSLSSSFAQKKSPLFSDNVPSSKIAFQQNIISIQARLQSKLIMISFSPKSPFQSPQQIMCFLHQPGHRQRVKKHVQNSNPDHYICDLCRLRRRLRVRVRVL